MSLKGMMENLKKSTTLMLAAAVWTPVALIWLYISHIAQKPQLIIPAVLTILPATASFFTLTRKNHMKTKELFAGTMFCPACGIVVASDTRYCSNCGISM